MKVLERYGPYRVIQLQDGEKWVASRKKKRHDNRRRRMSNPKVTGKAVYYIFHFKL